MRWLWMSGIEWVWVVLNEMFTKHGAHKKMGWFHEIYPNFYLHKMGWFHETYQNVYLHKMGWFHEHIPLVPGSSRNAFSWLGQGCNFVEVIFFKNDCPRASWVPWFYKIPNFLWGLVSWFCSDEMGRCCDFVGSPTWMNLCTFSLRL